MNRLRKWSRIIHRDLSFFFAGVIIIYAFSGIMLNHKKDFNADYKITRTTIQAPGTYPRTQDGFTRASVTSLLETIGEEKNYTKHYFPEPGQMKVFLKGGSSLVVNLSDGNSLYESVKKRPVISAFNRLHYNPGRWWTVFSDIFAVSLLIITVSGMVMIKGSKGIAGRGGLELAAGILIPLAFLFFS